MSARTLVIAWQRLNDSRGSIDWQSVANWLALAALVALGIVWDPGL